MTSEQRVSAGQHVGWTPSDKAAYGELVRRVASDPRELELRMLCPRGHFIAWVAVTVHEGMPMLWMYARGPKGEYSAHFRSSTHGLSLDTQSVDTTIRVHAKCMNRKCRYSGAMNFYKLTSEVASMCLAGHAEYRLTN